MISEQALERACRPAIFGRAHIIAKRGDIWSRSCSYEGSLTKLSAHVVSSSGYEDFYKTTVELDEPAERLVSYSCSCPAAHRFSGPCKHSMALALDFIHEPTAYVGYHELAHVRTSSSLDAYLNSTAMLPVSSQISGAEEPEAAVHLGVTLSHKGGLFARFQLSGSRGAYVVRSLSDFVTYYLDGSWHEYGKNLAFTHTKAVFDQASQNIADFLVRCVLNRRSFAEERVLGHVYATPGSSAIQTKRELKLSGPELDELIELYMDKTLEFEELSSPYEVPTKGAQTSSQLTVCDQDPELFLTLEPTENNAFELVRSTKAVFFFGAQYLYAVQEGKLFRCSEKLRKLEGFLTSVYSDAGRILLAHDDAPRFASRILPQLEDALRVDVPQELESMRPEPCRLEFRLDRSRAKISCEIIAHYGDHSYNVLERKIGARFEEERDGAREIEAKRVVGRYFQFDRTPRAFLSERKSDVVAALIFEGLDRLKQLGELSCTESFERLMHTTTPRVQVALSVKAHLLNLSFSAGDLPTSELYALLSSYREHRRFHRLHDGSFIDLRKLDLSQAAQLADELGLSSDALARGSVSIPSYKAFLLDAMLDDKQKDDAFKAYLEHFCSVDPRSFEPPAALAARLRPYQVVGYQWLNALCSMNFGGILADEMGLGKSLQLIALVLAHKGEGQTLIVCPASLVYNWVAEFTKFAPQLDVAPVVGTAAERAAIRSEAGHDVLVTSYDLLRRDIEDFAALSFWCEVLDEAQYIKNHETLVARATKVIQAQHRFALTGTPIENRLSELWSIFDYLMPGLLGGYDHFKDRYEQPILEGDTQQAKLLSKSVAPFVLRRLKSEVLSDLPDKLEHIVYAKLGGEQLRLYKAYEQQLRESLRRQDDAHFGQDKIQVLAALMRLRQLCCDPRLVYENYDAESAKLDALMDVVSSALDSSAKMLIFSQFTSYLKLIAERLDEQGISYYTITGATPKHRRLQLVNAFNKDKTPVFLISLKAGGFGLNLTGASVVIHADPWWNSAAQDQATDRAHRIGQTRDVSVYKVIAQDTIEDRILALQEAKSELAQQVVGGTGTVNLALLKKEDLIELLGS